MTPRTSAASDQTAPRRLGPTSESGSRYRHAKFLEIQLEGRTLELSIKLPVIRTSKFAQARSGSHTFSTLSIVVRTAPAWIGLSNEARARALEDPWAWRDVVTGIDGTALPIQRNELLFLVHPGVFGEVVSADNRETIRVAFVGEVEGQTDDDPDAAFQPITIALQQKAKGPALYYAEPLAFRWQVTSRNEPMPGPDPETTPPRSFSGCDLIACRFARHAACVAARHPQPHRASQA